MTPFGEMIHVDQNHHTSALSPKQNLILPTTDQHNIISWSPLRHDDKPFLQDQDNYLSESTTGIQPDLDPPNNPSNNDSAASLPGPVTPVDDNDPVLTRISASPSTASPADAADRSSSLTPPPDSGSPHPVSQSQDLTNTFGEPPSDSVDAAREEEEEEEVAKKEEEEEQAVEKLSRQSTPLSELSTAPEQADKADVDGVGQSETNADPPNTIEMEKSVADVDVVSAPESSVVATDSGIIADMKDESVDQSSEASNPSPSKLPDSSPPRPPSPQQIVPSESSAEPSSSSQPQSSIQNGIPSTPSIPSQSPSSEAGPSSTPTISGRPSTSKSPISPSPPSKAVTILELNAELLK